MIILKISVLQKICWNFLKICDFEGCDCYIMSISGYDTACMSVCNRFRDLQPWLMVHIIHSWFSIISDCKCNCFAFFTAWQNRLQFELICKYNSIQKDNWLCSCWNAKLWVNIYLLIWTTLLSIPIMFMHWVYSFWSCWNLSLFPGCKDAFNTANTAFGW